MKYAGALFCLVVGVAVVEAISISGSASFNKTGVSAGGSLIFPRIPGINAPLSSLFGSRTTTPATTNTGSLLSSLLSLFDLPDPLSLIPDFSSAANTSDVQVPTIPELADLSELSSIPGLSGATREARRRVTQALQLGSNFTAGIEQAIQDAFASDDPTEALRTIVQTILNAYLTVAANCPLMVIGSRVLQEGIRLAIEVARSARNVILGTTSAP